MKRFMRVAFFLVVISALLLPALPAGSAPGAGVTLFTSTNDIVAKIVAGAESTAEPLGLCFPGLVPTAVLGSDSICALPSGVPPATADHRFDADTGAFLNPVGTRCLTVSSHGGVTVTPNSNLDNNCQQVTSGTVSGAGRYTSPGDATAEGPNPLGPTCGSSSGTSAGGAADVFRVDHDNNAATAMLEYPTRFFWLSSAGGTLLVIGEIDLGVGDTHNYVAVTQTRALTRPDGKVQCGEVVGTTFHTIGVSVVSPVANP